MSAAASLSRLLGALWFRRMRLEGPPLPEGPIALVWIKLAIYLVVGAVSVFLLNQNRGQVNYLNGKIVGGTTI
ncbi:MAG TPA: hypothetical protein VFF77_03865, partial [Holophagaceae bacterium]|nr:hypothetical protein [Holophagaceae bacterium]